MSKKALGKGIEALIGIDDQGEVLDAAGGVETVDLNAVKPNPEQPRKSFSEESLKELADSIRAQGVIQPILVEKQGDSYFLIAGERRYRAARLAGLSAIPAVIGSYSEEQKLEIALVENIQREDLNPVEEALAYKSLMDKTGLNQAQVAEKVGKQRSTVANSLRLLRLPEEMRDALGGGTLSSGHARALLSVENPADRQILFGRIRKQGLSVREAERMAGELNAGKRMKEKHEPDAAVKLRNPELMDMEQKLIDKFGTKVSVKGSPKKGHIEISYFSLDDLNRLYDILLEEE